MRGEGEPQEGDVFDQRGVLQRVSSRGWSVCSLWMGEAGEDESWIAVSISPMLK